MGFYDTDARGAYIQASIDARKVETGEMDEVDFKETYGKSTHAWKLKHSSGYAEQQKKVADNTPGARITLPEENLNSSIYTGNPNMAYARPNQTTAATIAGTESFNNEVIEAVLPIPFLETGQLAKGYKAAKGLFNKGINSVDDVIEGGKVYHANEKIWELKSKVNNYDDLLELPDADVETLTGMSKELWEKTYDKYGAEKIDRMLGSKLKNAGKTNLIDAPKYLDESGVRTKMAEKAKQKQRDWLMSDEWLKRRMTATGETEKQAKMARASMAHKLNRTELDLKDAEGIEVQQYGLALSGKEGDPKIWMAVDDSDLTDLERFQGNAQHEYIHASNTWDEDYTMKGIEFPEITTNSESAEVKSVVRYLNAKAEKQVRGVKALDHLKEKGLWGSGNVSDEAIAYLKNNVRRLDNDVASLVTNTDRQGLQKFLNKVYVGLGVTAAGKGLYNITMNTLYNKEI